MIDWNNFDRNRRDDEEENQEKIGTIDWDNFGRNTSNKSTIDWDNFNTNNVEEDKFLKDNGFITDQKTIKNNINNLLNENKKKVATQKTNTTKIDTENEKRKPTIVSETDNEEEEKKEEKSINGNTRAGIAREVMHNTINDMREEENTNENTSKFNNIVNKVSKNNEIAKNKEMLSQINADTEEWEFFKAPAFEDGYQFGDVTKSVLGTLVDTSINVIGGVMSLPENIIDFGANIIATGQDVLGFDEAAKDTRDWANIDYSQRFINLMDASSNYEDYSFFGETTDNIFKTVGYAGAMMYGGNLLGSIGKTSSVGNASLGVSANIGNISVKIAGHTLRLPTLAFFGGASSKLAEANAKGDSVTELERWGSAFLGGTIEMATEGIFGLFGVGGSDITDNLILKVTRHINSKIGKMIAKTGFSALGEGSEEVLSYIGNYVSDNFIIDKLGSTDFSSKWSWSDLFEQFFLGFASTAIMGTGGNIIQTNDAVKAAENQLGRKLTSGEKAQVTQAVISQEMISNEVNYFNDENDLNQENLNMFFVSEFSQDGNLKNIEATIGMEIENPNTEINTMPVIIRNKLNGGYNIIDANTGLILDNTYYNTVSDAQNGFNNKMTNLDNASIRNINNKIIQASIAINNKTNEVASQAKSKNVANNTQTPSKNVIEIPESGLNNVNVNTNVDVNTDNANNTYTNVDTSTTNMSDRNFENVSNKNVLPYQEEHTEVQPEIQEMANRFIEDLANSTEGKRYKTGNNWTGQKRNTTRELAYIKDNTGASWSQIGQALEDITNNKGNYALAKKVEIVLDDALTNGYRNIYGQNIMPNDNYISKKSNYESIQQSNNSNDDFKLDDYRVFGEKTPRKRNTAQTSQNGFTDVSNSKAINNVSQNENANVGQNNTSNLSDEDVRNIVKYNPDGREISDSNYVDFLVERYKDNKNISGVVTDTRYVESIENKIKKDKISDLYEKIKDKEFKITKELRDENGELQNVDLDLVITKKGLNESFNKGFSNEKYAIVPYLDEIIKTSQDGTIRAETKMRSNIMQWYYLYNTAEINGELYGVKVDIKKTPQGDRFYVHRVNLVHKDGTANQIPAVGNGTIKINTVPSTNTSISQNKQSVKNNTNVTNKSMQNNKNNTTKTINSLNDIKTKYANQTDQLNIFENKDNTISINNIVVKQNLRNKGIGQSILNDIMDYADKTNKTITLTPTSEYLTKNKLINWYKRNGFVENKGKNTDFSISDTMYKLPKNNMQNNKNVKDNGIRAERTSTTTEYDNQGNRLTRAQRDFFKDSKVRDENGKLKVVYHGTQRADRVGNYFDPNKATSGPMAFFTDNREIAANYSTQKQDTSLSREYDTEFDLFKVNGMDLDTYWNSLESDQKQEIINRSNNIGFDEDFENIIYEANASRNSFGDQFEWRLKNEYNGNALRSLYSIWIEDGNLMQEDMSKFKTVLEYAGLSNIEYLDLYKTDSNVYEVYLNIKNPFDTSNISKNIIKQLENASKTAKTGEMYSADLWDKSNISPKAWIEKLHNDLENNSTHAWTVIPDWVTNVLKTNGYDGIIDTGGKGGGVEHQVVIPFYSNQIKNITNKKPTTSNPDIRYESTNNSTSQPYDARRYEKNADFVNYLKENNYLKTLMEVDEKQGETYAHSADRLIEQEIRKLEETNGFDNSIPVTKLTDIDREIENYLGKTIGKGHFRERARGIYNQKTDNISVKEYKDLDNVFHELGHALDLGGRIKVDKANLSDELLAAVTRHGGYENETIGVQLDEGFAEILKTYAINKDIVKQDYPKSYKVLEDFKASDVNFGKFITKIQQDTYNYIHQNPQNRILSNVSIGEQTDREQLTKDKITKKVVKTVWDSNYEIKQMVNEFTKATGHKPTASQNAYLLTRLASGVDNKAISMISNGYIDLNGNRLMPGLNRLGEILGDNPQRWDDLRAFLVAQRDLEYKAKSLKTGVRSMDSKAVVEKFYNDTQIQEAAQVVYDTLDGVLQYAVDNKLITEETAKALRESNAFYVPFQRVVEGKGNNNSRRGAVSEIIRRRTGSELDIRDVLENIVENSANIIRQVEKNNVLKMTYEQGEEAGMNNTIFREVSAPMKKIGTEQLKTWENELKNQGVDTSSLDLEKTIDLFVPNNDIVAEKDGSHIISFFDKDGSRKYLQFYKDSTDIFNSLMGLDGKIMSQILKLNRRLNMPLRYGATMANVGFAIPNMISDTVQATIYSEAGFIPVVDNVIGILDVLGATNKTVRNFLNQVAPEYAQRINRIYDIYQQTGASSSTKMSQYRKSTQEIMRDIYGTKNSEVLGIKDSFKPLKRLMDILTYIPELSESSTRFRVFERNYEAAKNKGSSELDARIQAAIESRDATQDFGRTGTVMKEVNQLIPFSAARVGSAYTFAEKVKANPKRTAARVAILLTVALAIKAIGYDDDEIEELNQRKKDDNFVFKVGDTVITIKKPQGILRSIINLGEYILDLSTGHIEEGKEGERLVEWTTNTLKDNLPADNPLAALGSIPIIGGLAENTANKDFYYNTDIVKSWDLDLPDEQQYYDYTSQLAIALGQVFNYSPAKIDNFISSYLGGLGTQLTNTIDWISGKMGLSAEEPAMGAEDNAIGKRFVVNVNENSASVDEIYEREEELTKKQNGGTITAEEEQELEEIKAGITKMSALNKQIKAIKQDLTMSGEEKAEAIRPLQEQKVDVARQALGKDPIYTENTDELNSLEFYPSRSTLSYNGYTLELTEDMKQEYEDLAYDLYKKYEKQGLYSEDYLDKLKSKCKDAAKKQIMQKYRSKLTKSK